MSYSTVATPEDMEALPVDTIVRIGKTPFVLAEVFDRAPAEWIRAGDDVPLTIAEIREHWGDLFPATVLYRPDPTEES